MKAPRNAEKYQGKPCFRGHAGVRYVCNGDCVECAALRFSQPEKGGRSEYLNTLDVRRLANAPDKYWGAPCAYQHSGLRYRRNRVCVECDILRRRRKRKGLMPVLVRALPGFDPRRRRGLRPGTETFRGKPCPWGHDGLRYCSTRDCVECTYERPRNIGRRRAGDRRPGSGLRRGPWPGHPWMMDKLLAWRRSPTSHAKPVRHRPERRIAGTRAEALLGRRRSGCANSSAKAPESAGLPSREIDRRNRVTQRISNPVLAGLCHGACARRALVLGKAGRAEQTRQHLMTSAHESTAKNR